MHEKIPGGMSSGKNPSDFDPKSLAAGIKVEMEHTTDPKIAREIAMDHLTEDPEYYVKLKKMEKKGSSLKLARVFGESEPHVQTKGVPFEQNKRMFRRYLEMKSKEDPSSTGASALFGGALGGAAGGVLGGIRHGAGGALLGGGIGALGGAGLGVLAKAIDEGKIREAKKILGKGGPAVDDALIRAMHAQEVHAEAMKDLRGQLRQHAIESASQGRHEELLDALKKQKHDSPSNSLPRHAPTTSAMTEKTCKYCDTSNPGTRSNCKNCGAPLPQAELLGKMASAYDAALMEKEAINLPRVPAAVAEPVGAFVTNVRRAFGHVPQVPVQPLHMTVPGGAPSREISQRGALQAKTRATLETRKMLENAPTHGMTPQARKLLKVEASPVAGLGNRGRQVGPTYATPNPVG